MNIVRRVSLSAAAGLLGVAVTLGWVSERPAASMNAVSQMAAATSYFDSTIVLARVAQPRGVRGDELAIALGYLERLRLGLGSPFRLVDEALNDPRLGGAMSPRVAWALLGRLRRNDAYVIDRTVLDGAGPWTPNGQGATGEAHVALITRAIESASDPRAGELAVRLAYTIESAKGGISPSTASIAAQVAALARDHAFAAIDLRALLADAATDRSDVFATLSARRQSHTLDVERPSLAPLPRELQTEAMNAVPALVRALDTLDRARENAPRATAMAPVIGARFAARLRALGDARPPVAQVFVTLRGRASLDADNEETLTAASAIRLASARDDSTNRTSALAMLASAVAVRSLAQESPWFPGDGGPDQADLAAEFGLAGVSFGRGVPAAWQPYYLRQLQNGLRDIGTVLPAISFAGLHVRFGVEALRDSALAMHDPRDRTLNLPIATAGGTLAHELSHDLDWQAARRLYAGGTGYSTDRAVHDRRGALATSLRALADARPLRAYSGVAPVDRPAELFARGADWFVATALAQQGRTNGFLSAIEDGVLAGYAAGAPAAAGIAGTASLLSAIGTMTYLPDSVRNAFAAQWSDASAADPALLVRRVLETPITLRLGRQWNDVPLVALPPVLCTARGTAGDRARESLLMLAIEARARGTALRRARFRPTSMRPGWAGSLLSAPPFAPGAGDAMIDALRSAIVAELGSSLPNQGILAVVPATFRSSASSCSTIAR